MVFNRLVLAILLATLASAATIAEERYEAWEPLKSEFPSTGGGGVMIKDYKPVITDGKCVTPFTAHMPDGAIYSNIVEFETEAAQGGTLCKNGRWRSADGSATGTTPLRVFIKDGIARRSP